MKFLKTLFLISTISISMYAQKDYLPDTFNEQPDGVLLRFLNYSEHNIEDNLSPTNYCIFINDGLKLRMDLKFENNSNGESTHKKIYKDISRFQPTLDSLEILISDELIDSIKSCCRAYKCGDTGYGYYIQIKKGNAFKFTTFDLNKAKASECGNEQFSEVIRLFDRLIALSEEG